MVRLRTIVTSTTVIFAVAGCGGGDVPANVAATPARATPPAGAVVGSAPAAAGAGTPAPLEPTGAGTPAPSGPAGSAAAPGPPVSAGGGEPISPAPRPGGTAASGAPPSGVDRYVFPVEADDVDFHPTHGKYPATDIFADCGEPVVAVADGVVLEVSRKDTYVSGRPDGPANGGLSVSLLADDGVRYYGSHLSEVRAGLAAGDRVSAGERLGRLGRTGNANGVCHLHFGISPPCGRTGDWKVRRGVVWPAPYLTSWRAKGSKSPVGEVERWRATHDCRA